MSFRNTVNGWGWPARLLHWAMAVMILGLLGVGFYMAQILTAQDSDTLMLKFDLVQIHKSWGFMVFALALVRVFWRFANPTPALPDGMGRFERLAAHGGHLALYVCLIAMPVTGWLMASASPLQDAYGIKNMVFGLFELPDPFQPGGEAPESLFRTLHFYIALVMTFLLLTHAGAALKHHFIDKDSVLSRMIRG